MNQVISMHKIAGKTIGVEKGIEYLYRVIFDFDGPLEEILHSIPRIKRTQVLNEFSSLFDPYTVIKRQQKKQHELNRRHIEMISKFEDNYKISSPITGFKKCNRANIIIRVNGPSISVRNFFIDISRGKLECTSAVLKNISDLPKSYYDNYRYFGGNAHNNPDMTRFSGDAVCFTIAYPSENYSYQKIVEKFFNKLRMYSLKYPDLSIDLSTKIHSCYNIYTEHCFYYISPGLYYSIGDYEEVTMLREKDGVISEYPMEFRVEFTRFANGEICEIIPEEYITI